MSSRVGGSLPTLHVEDGRGPRLPPSPLKVHQIFSAGIDHAEVVIDKGTLACPMAARASETSDMSVWTFKSYEPTFIDVKLKSGSFGGTDGLDWLLI